MNLHKAIKLISGLTFLASILLFIDYYLPPAQNVVVIEKTSFRKEVSHYRGYTSTTYFTFAYAHNIKISTDNFRCITPSAGDTLLLTRTAIYKIQTELVGVSSYYSGKACIAEYDPFVFRGLFILISILFSFLSIRTNDLLSSILLTGISCVIFFALVLAPLLFYS